VPPEYAARLLGGTLTWQQANQRLWVAVVRFDAPVDAMATPERPRF
jgi:hypothetical protein